MHAESMLQGVGFEILLQRIYFDDIGTQHFILGSIEFHLRRNGFILNSIELGLVPGNFLT